jgi:hypothetical protein
MSSSALGASQEGTSGGGGERGTSSSASGASQEGTGGGGGGTSSPASGDDASAAGAFHEDALSEADARESGGAEENGPARSGGFSKRAAKVAVEAMAVLGRGAVQVAREKKEEKLDQFREGRVRGTVGAKIAAAIDPARFGPKAPARKGAGGGPEFPGNALGPRGGAEPQDEVAAFRDRNGNAA